MKLKTIIALSVSGILLGSAAIYLAASNTLTHRTPAVVVIASPTPSITVSPTPQREFQMPILMYHYIRSYRVVHDELGIHLSVSPETFTAQLDYLKAHNYNSASFENLHLGRLPNHPVMLTFDDGYIDAYTTAFPALKAHQMRGTFYIVSGFVGTPGYVTWDQLREMKQAGMEIGAHTIDHIDLAKSSAAEQRRQIFDSIATIKQEVGGQIITFAYPSGKYNADTTPLLQEAGINYAVTTQPGLATNEQDPLLLSRVRVESDTNFDNVL